MESTDKGRSSHSVIEYRWNVDSDDLHWSDDTAALIGALPQNLPANGYQLSLLINPQDLPQRLSVVHSALCGAASGDGCFDITFRLRLGDGQQVYASERGEASIDETGHTIIQSRISFKAVGAALSATSHFNASGLVQYDPAQHMGRSQILCQIGLWIGDQGRMPGKGYFLAVGIDRLSIFNEAFGFQRTDQLIEAAERRLRHSLGEQAVVQRIGGDVFGVLVRSGPAAEMPAVARHILSSFHETPLITCDGPARIGVSIGGFVLNGEVNDPAAVIVKAEAALGMAKEQGRGCFVSYAEIRERSEDYRHMLEMGDHFLKAFHAGNLRLAYQPVIDSRTGKSSFHECLIRIIGEDGKLMSAAKFIPAVEALGLSRLLDRYTIRLAIQELAMFSDLSLSVNVSAWSLADPSWLRGVVMALRDSPSIARRLIIEITESVAIQDMGKTENVVRTLKDMGCRVALDDFGSGHTAFTQRQTLDIDIVKIDKSFIRNMTQGNNYLFVKILQSLADSVNIETVGEGAETQAEAEILQRDGITHIQGYVYGMPSTERLWLSDNHIHRKQSLIINQAGDDVAVQNAFYGTA